MIKPISTAKKRTTNLDGMQELIEVVGRSSGVVLMAPPTESAEAAASMSTLLSRLKPKQKVSAVDLPVSIVSILDHEF